MENSPSAAIDDTARYEILPLGRAEQEAAELPGPVRLTVTCSPKHGPERSIEVGERLRALGHAVTMHVAARTVRDRAHLDALMNGIADAGADDIFVIGGDGEPKGEFCSAVELLPLIAEHPRRAGTLGIAGYPEGHPMIGPDELDQALAEKSRLADYVTTQMCFDPEALEKWTRRQRERGMSLPVLVGMPGQVPRRKLVEMSVRIGVGPSISFARKQRGIRALFGRSTADKLYDAFAPALDDAELKIGGFHYFTFNQLVDTWQWHTQKQGDRPRRAGQTGSGAPRSYVQPEERTT